MCSAMLHALAFIPLLGGEGALLVAHAVRKIVIVDWGGHSTHLFIASLVVIKVW